MEEQLAEAQAQIAQLTRQLADQQAGLRDTVAGAVRAALEATAAAPSATVPPPRPAALYDSRAFARVEKFSGLRSDWKTFEPVFRSFVSTQRHESALLMVKAENADPGDDLSNVSLDAGEEDSSRELHYVLTLTCLGDALDRVMNAGPGEGALAWRALVDEYDPRTALHASGAMCEVLKHVFTADTSTFASFERKVLNYQRISGKVLDEDMKVGVVISNMSDSEIQKHLMMNTRKLKTYRAVCDEVQDILHTRSATSAGPLVDALAKGK